MTPSTAPRPRPPRRLAFAGLVAALLLSVLAATTPGSGAALTARLTNSADTAGTARYFTCAAAITANSPSVYYKLDETGLATTATDSSGQNRPGTYRGTTTKSATSDCSRDSGTAVTFNGSSGYIGATRSLLVPATASITARFKTTSTAVGLIVGFGALSSGPSTTVDRVLYLTNTGALVFGINNGAKATITASGTYRDGQWHHVMATVGPGGMRLYVDGAQAATSSTTATGSYTGFFRVGYDNLTGWPNAPSSSYLNGTLDEVAAYSTTLTATDAANHWAAGS